MFKKLQMANREWIIVDICVGGTQPFGTTRMDALRLIENNNCKPVNDNIVLMATYGS